ncbi:MAG TPA: Na(+)/H(+) antiporter subunit D [Vicinamibacteria bacterium]|nr:Na(+)/H(+) antiporter subunit D [Vicinamibacteria bacterium]
MTALHPAFVLFITALLAALTASGTRRVVVVLGSVIALLSWTGLDFSSRLDVNFGDYRLSLLHVDPLSLVFGLVFALVAFIGAIYALHLDRRSETVATLAYAGSSLGVVFAGDWVTLFVFWELMAISSLFVIWNGRSSRSGAAGNRYLLVHISGGSLLFAGILVLLDGGGSLQIEPLTVAPTDPLAFWLILLGVSVNAAIPPLHAWLTDAYPEASVTGSVFLSAFTTKTAVYVLIRVFPGADILVGAGVVMALYGVVYAVLENDIRRLLAYHIVSQVGYMVAGVGMGTALALDGATAHAFSHILYKALLFMGAGAVLHATGLRKLTDLGGIATDMKLVVLLYTVGAFSISGVPLFNGFISKSMVISAAMESHRPVVELLLTLASVGTFLHTGLKLPYFTFFGPRKSIDIAPLPLNMLVGMGVAALLCTAFGVAPSLLYRVLPYASDYHPYTLDHVLSSIQLLLGTAIAFFLLLSKLGGEPTMSLDTDWIYRRPLKSVVSAVVAASRSAGAELQSLGSAIVEKARSMLGAAGTTEIREESDPFRFRSPIGVTVFWIVVYFTALALAALARQLGTGP